MVKATIDRLQHDKTVEDLVVGLGQSAVLAEHEAFDVARQMALLWMNGWMWG